MKTKITNGLSKYMREKLYDWDVVEKRKHYTQKMLENRLNTIDIASLTEDEHRLINSVWSKYKSMYDERWFAYYKTLYPDSDLSKFIPNDFYYSYIDPYFNPPHKGKVFDDKNLYDLYFHDVKQPRTICRKIDGLYLDESYHIIRKEEAVKKCEECGNVIIKPAIGTDGSKGICMWKSGVCDLSKLLDDRCNVVIQQVLDQHPNLAYLHSSSLNTIRIMTFLYEEEVNVISAVVRMGANGSVVDNFSVGGLVCGVSQSGRLTPMAYDKMGRSYEKHPQGAIFGECVVPNWANCLSLVKGLAPRLNSISKIASWDLAIDRGGGAVLIEVNLSYGGIGIHQTANGPVFGDWLPILLPRLDLKF